MLEKNKPYLLLILAVVVLSACNNKQGQSNTRAHSRVPGPSVQDTFDGHTDSQKPIHKHQGVVIDPQNMRTSQSVQRLMISYYEEGHSHIVGFSDTNWIQLFEVGDDIFFTHGFDTITSFTYNRANQVWHKGYFLPCSWHNAKTPHSKLVKQIQN